MATECETEVDTCHSCFLSYNNKDRAPKILTCYHTYCKSCLSEFMFNGGNITCLACGKETPVPNVDSIPDNPYFRPSSRSENNRRPSGQREEVYYSDSDDDSLPTPRAENGINGDHVQGVKDMVMNTQRANILKVRSLIETNRRKLDGAMIVTKAREHVLTQSLRALEDYHTKVKQQLQTLKADATQLSNYQIQMANMEKNIGKVDLMDFTTVKQINDDCLKTRDTLKTEIEKARHNDLDNAIRQSRVKINFETTDPLLMSLKADNDKIFMKLSSSLETDPSMVYLTTFLLANIFTDKISGHNTHFKDFIKNSYVEADIEAPQILDDPTEFIDYVRAFQHLNLAASTTEAAPSNSSRSETPAAASPQQEDKEWKTVAPKEKKISQTFSFSEMAKRPGQPQPVVKRVPFPEKTIAQTNRPHCYFKVQIDNDPPFRVVLEMRPDMAPKMVDNFVKLCKGLPDGRGYKGSKIFRAKANDHVLGGDFENDDGTGGHSAYQEKYFLAEQCPLKDHKGAIRMKGLERTPDGRCRIGSQFMIWVGDLEYKEYKFTLVFGKVVEGFEQLQEVSRIRAVQKSPTSWILRQTVTIIESGVL